MKLIVSNASRLVLRVEREDGGHLDVDVTFNLVLAAVVSVLSRVSGGGYVESLAGFGAVFLSWVAIDVLVKLWGDRRRQRESENV